MNKNKKLIYHICRDPDSSRGFCGIVTIPAYDLITSSYQHIHSKRTTTQSTNHYTITAIHMAKQAKFLILVEKFLIPEKKKLSI